MGYPTQLSGATTPTGSAPGILSQVWGWITGSVPNAANAPQNVQDWMASQRAQGLFITRYPVTDDIGAKGDLASAERTTTGGTSYYLAPDDVLQADYVMRGLSWAARPVGAAAAAGQAAGEAVQSGVKVVLQAPRQALADITGIDPTVITGALLVGAAAFIYGQVRKR